MDPQLLTLLIALIAPVAALGGVALGQWMQRRTTREQLAAQDRRDELTRTREDRHRFTSEKRVLYAELLAMIDRFIAEGMNAMHRVSHDMQMLRISNPDGDVADQFDAMIAHTAYPEMYQTLMTEFKNLLCQVELVSPKFVRDGTRDVRVELRQGWESCVVIWDAQRSVSSFAKAAFERDILMDQLRFDLEAEPVS